MPWLIENVFKQSASEPLVRIERFGDGPKRVRFRHIIHAYRDKKTPQNTHVQRITFETARTAIQFAAPDYQVSIVGVTFADDLDLLPLGVIPASCLTRVVGDFADFQVSRPLPLLFDILSLGSSADLPSSERGFSRLKQVGPIGDEIPEYVIMTNSDIHLQPSFYKVLGTLIAQGYDVISVNRRTLDVDLDDRAFTPLFMADHGKEHGGFDCFVFPRAMMDNFVTSYSCCGAGYVMRSLLYNLVAQARRFLMLTQAHLTFHLGDDAPWLSPSQADYFEYNRAQATAVVAELSKDPVVAERLAKFISVHE